MQQTSVWDESAVKFSAYRCDVGDPFGESGPLLKPGFPAHSSDVQGRRYGEFAPKEY